LPPSPQWMGLQRSSRHTVSATPARKREGGAETGRDRERRSGRERERER